MKKKIQTLCWVLFTIFSAGCLFINFISEPPVDNVKALTGYMICAAAVSVLYPGAMLFLGLRNRWLYEQLQRKAEGEREALKSLSPTSIKRENIQRHPFAHKADKTLQTLEKCDVHYLCIKDFHLPFNKIGRAHV